MTPFQRFSQAYRCQQVVVMGLGLQGRGVGSTKILAQIGAQVTVTDQKTAHQLQPSLQQLKHLPITYALGDHPQQLLQHTDFIIRNASVPWDHPFLQAARRQNIPIKMDATLFFEFARPTRAVGITGTRGKTTTTHLIHHLLVAHHTATLAGNATPTASLELLQTYSPQTWYVFELSSWQLQAFHQEKISPHLSVITNLYPDHLLHQTFSQYVHDKTAIFAYQSHTDTLFINQQDRSLTQLAHAAPSRVIPYSPSLFPHTFSPTLRGAHNLNNLAAAFALSEYLQLPHASTLATLSSFAPLPHRLEPLHSINHIHFINDSTSTTPTALQVALATYPNSILIAGGTSKDLPLTPAIQAINAQAKAVYLLQGSGTDQLLPHLTPSLINRQSPHLSDLVRHAYQAAKPGDTVLFSPGFTSFELFTNEFDRGNQFKYLVHQLPSPTHP